MFRTRTILSSDSPAQAAARLQAVVHTADRVSKLKELRLMWAGRHPPEFVGRIEGNRFNLRRLTMFRGSYLVLLRGRIDAAASGSAVSVRMRPHAALMGITLLPMAVIQTGITLAVWRALMAGQRLDGTTLVTAVSPLLIVAIFALRFHHAANDAERALRRNLAP